MTSMLLLMTADVIGPVLLRRVTDDMSRQRVT